MLHTGACSLWDYLDRFVLCAKNVSKNVVDYAHFAPAEEAVVDGLVWALVPWAQRATQPMLNDIDYSMHDPAHLRTVQQEGKIDRQRLSDAADGSTHRYSHKQFNGAWAYFNIIVIFVVFCLLVAGGTGSTIHNRGLTTPGQRTRQSFQGVDPMRFGKGALHNDPQIQGHFLSEGNGQFGPKPMGLGTAIAA